VIAGDDQRMAGVGHAAIHRQRCGKLLHQPVRRGGQALRADQVIVVEDQSGDVTCRTLKNTRGQSIQPTHSIEMKGTHHIQPVLGEGRQVRCLPGMISHDVPSGYATALTLATSYERQARKNLTLDDG
jgi:hypothetical protein